MIMWRIYLDSWTWQTALPAVVLLTCSIVVALRKSRVSAVVAWAIGVVGLGLFFMLSIAYIYSWQFYQSSIKDFPQWWSLFPAVLLMFALIALSDGLISVEKPLEFLVVLLGYAGVVCGCGLLLFAAIDLFLFLSIGISGILVLRGATIDWRMVIAYLLLCLSIFYALLHILETVRVPYLTALFRGFLNLHPALFFGIYVIITLSLEFYMLHVLRSANRSGLKAIHPVWFVICALYHVIYMLWLVLGYFNPIRLMTFFFVSGILGCIWIFGVYKHVIPNF